MEDYFFETKEVFSEKKLFVLIIYDIVDNGRRNRLANFLQGYGFRIQKSAFEALISEKIYHKMMAGLPQFATEEDSIRVYRIIGKGHVEIIGKRDVYDAEDLIII